ncbi:MAG: transporter substrate-binding domain-containing protein [Gammaproteobacteria bacterium]|nr:transporter substrate-binding domain-containing protein [Gammaproteobacteria bacterium]NNL49758.1 transporter substrate-binding domain-containing protein [Woeseiaceae bacterium]
MHRFKLLARLLPLLSLFVASLASADVLDEILDRGAIRVGVAEFVPWTMRTKSGDLIGFEVDVAKQIAADMGVSVELKVYEWDAIIPALDKGEIDVIAGGMAITPERALRVNFSRPLALSGVGLATNTMKTQDMKTLDDLNDKSVTITTVAETMAANVAETLFERANVKVFATKEPAEKEVLEGRAHAYLAAIPEVRFLVLRNPAKLDLPINEPLVASSEALAVKKGEQQLLNFLDAWVTVRQTDNWLATSHDYWFGTLDWTPTLGD